ncbi:MAG: hypothetical protein JXR77_03915 [Lentisphaeria bacterium]|nr:hypothetical protein [Lentisphaeria bacterium]
MVLRDLLDVLETGHRRYQVLRLRRAAVVIALDVEGRLFAALDDEVLHRVNPEALLASAPGEVYGNPGGDGLWPAPEGSCLGYQYATGAWSVPPGLTGARFALLRTTPATALLRARVDLVNAAGVGLPTAFERRVRLRQRRSGMAVLVDETIRYLGTRTLTRREALLAPWTLCQFDSGPGCEAVFPAGAPGCVWDLYEPSEDCRALAGTLWRARTEGGPRYQLGLSEDVEWVEFRDPARGLVVHRTAARPPAPLGYIDIADRPPAEAPGGMPVRFSVYNDPTGFMEIEAAGGAPATLHPGACLTLSVTTQYHRKGDS